MQDMIPPRERSIRNIPISTNTNHPIPPRQTPPSSRRPSRTPFFRNILWILGILLVCALAGVVFSAFFENTTVTLYPHTQTVNTTGAITAQPDAGNGTLAYQTLSVTRSATTSASASGTQHVVKSATGIITIYNAYSTKPQKLITNTRFAAPSGDIYRIHAPVTVPGATRTSTGLQPGTVSATIYADGPGSAYNLASTTSFTIPGLKNTPEYTTVYAQSQGSISGGFIGNQPTVAPADLTTAEANLKQSLDSGVSTAVNSSIPPGFSLIPGTLQVSYTDIAQTQNPDTSITFAQSATGIAAIVRDTDLAAAVAKQTIPTYNNEPVTFAHPETLSISLGVSPGKTLGPLSLLVGNPVTIVWQIDQNAVAQALLGKPKSSFETIIQSFAPAVEQAKAQVRPFWESHFPTNTQKLTITVMSPQ